MRVSVGSNTALVGTQEKCDATSRVNAYSDQVGPAASERSPARSSDVACAQGQRSSSHHDGANTHPEKLRVKERKHDCICACDSLSPVSLGGQQHGAYLSLTAESL